MKIIGFYKDLRLVELDNICIVVEKTTKKILFKGTEEDCTKYFVMSIAGAIES